MMVGKRRSRRRSTGGRSPWLIIGLTVLVVTGAVGAGVDTGSVAFTSAASDRGASVDVAADDSGLLGVTVATSVTAGTTSRIVTVRNLVGQPIDLTVTVDGTTGTISNNQASLGSGDTQDVMIDVPCGSGAQTVTVSISATADNRFTGTATRSTSVDNSGCGTNNPKVAFVDQSTGDLTTVTASGSTTTYQVGDVTAVGNPNADLDGDGDTDVPYVDSTGSLKFVDSNANSRTLDGSGSVAADSLGVGDFDGSGTPEVYYVKNGNLFKAEVGVGTAEVVNNKRWNVVGIAGVADFDADGASEVVFTIDRTDRIAYLDDSGSVEGAKGKAIKVDSLTAISTPRDFDGDGAVEVAAYDSGSTGIVLFDVSGSDGTLSSSAPISETSMGALDYNGDGVVDVIHLDSSQQSLQALDATDDTTLQVTNTTGTQLTADIGAGVS